MIARIVLFLLCVGISFTSQAHYARSIQVDPQLESLSLRPTLYYQITDDTLEIEEFLLNPARHHAFQLVEEKEKLQIDTGQAVWLFVRLQYHGEIPLDTIIHYDFPLADQVTKVLLDRQSNRFQHHYHTGSDYPYDERLLPYPSFAFPLHLNPGQEIDVFLKIQDAGLVPLRLELWQQDSFRAAQNQLNLVAGIIYGLLIAVVLYNLYLLIRRRHISYLYQAGCYFSFGLIIATLNGQAFAYIWPNQPEINSAILYILAGSTLLCLNQFTYQALSSFKRQPWYILFLLNQALSLILLFTPLYASGQLRVHLLLTCALTVLISNCFVSFAHFLQGHGKARFFALLWLFLLISGGLIMLSEFGLLQLPMMWYEVALAALILSIACISYHYGHQNNHDALLPSSRTQQIKQLCGEALFAQSQGAVVIASETGRLLLANDSFYNLIGATTESTAKLDLQLDELLPEWPLPKTQGMESTAALTLELQNTYGDSFFITATTDMFFGPALEKMFCIKIQPLSDEDFAKTKISQLNELDNLTTLLNQTAFHNKLDSWLHSAEPGCLLQIDLIDFKRINEQCDQAAGDALLRQIATKLRHELPEATLARLSADKFGVLLPGKSSQEIFVLSYRLLDVLRGYRFIWQQHIFRMNASIGVVSKEHLSDNAEQALIILEQSCQQAKNKGSNRIHLFHPADQIDSVSEFAQQEWEHKLRSALTNNQLILNIQFIHQPEQPVQSRYEVLLRLRAEAGHLIPAANFIYAARRANLTQRLDRWVIERYFAWLYQHPAHLEQSSLCHINISAASIMDPDFKFFITEQLRLYKIPTTKICFEFDEYIAVEYLNDTIAFIKHVHELGCLVCLDNFGSGLSVFSYLKQLPIDMLKIDRSVTKNITTDPLNQAVLRCIIELAGSMKIQPIATHIETEEAYQLIRSYGLSLCQGFHLSKPCLLTEAYLQQ